MTLETKDDVVQATKHDKHKLLMRLFPIHARIEVAKVLTFGAGKYAEGNWGRGDGFKYGRTLDATDRHMTAFECGIEKDEETGLHPIAHAICELAFLLDQSLRNRGAVDVNDDREERQPIVANFDYHAFMSQIPTYTEYNFELGSEGENS